MEEKEIVEQLNQMFYTLTINHKLNHIYKINSYILNLLAMLNKINKPLFIELYNLATSIGSSSDIEQIHKFAKSGLAKLAKKEEISGFLTDLKVIKTEEYKKAIKKYANIQGTIEKTEFKIENATAYHKELHEKLKVGKYQDCLHARVNENLRIVYYAYYETKRLFYITILNHNDLDNSFRIKPINWKEKFSKYY